MSKENKLIFDYCYTLYRTDAVIIVIEQNGGGELFLNIEPQSDVPIYAQVRNGIMEGIVRGELKPGDFLPSVRGLASDLGVNMHTVSKSYHELESKGIIEIVPKSGAVICDLTVEGVPKERSATLSQELKPLVVEALVLGMKEKEINEMVESIITNVKESK